MPPTTSSEDPVPRGAPPNPPGAPRPRPGSPSVLDLVRLSPEPVFPPGGEALYRQIGILTEMASGMEVLDAACGRGLTTAFLAANYGVHGTGIDADPVLIAEAEQRARTMSLEASLTFQTCLLDDLPFQDGVFDLVIGEVGLAASFDPAAAVRELARVTRPMGTVVLVQLVWTGHVPEDRKEILVQHLGARPLLLVEWKQHLREGGCVDLYVEDWSDYSAPFRPAVAGPFHDIAQIFSLRQKVAILRRALRRWGWRGVRGAIVREQEIHRLLTRQRVLGLSLIKATRWPRDPEGGDAPTHPVD
jgi:SAM-dependent methyltransferase